jgi:regulator of protease activity HflC (stomatin/prohibitin superfamily)
MFERLIDLILQLGDKLMPCFLVDAYQHAGVLRFGKFHRTCEPGFHWKWPFVEHIIDVMTCITTLRLPPQTLTTSDGKAVVVAAIVRYSIDDVEPYICDIYDQHDALADVTMGAVRTLIREQTF